MSLSTDVLLKEWLICEMIGLCQRLPSGIQKLVPTSYSSKYYKLFILNNNMLPLSAASLLIVGKLSWATIKEQLVRLPCLSWYPSFFRCSRSETSDTHKVVSLCPQLWHAVCWTLKNCSAPSYFTGLIDSLFPGYLFPLEIYKAWKYTLHHRKFY